jgi:PAS domain S-box-containing protein
MKFTKSLNFRLNITLASNLVLVALITIGSLYFLDSIKSHIDAYEEEKSKVQKNIHILTTAIQKLHIAVIRSLTSENIPFPFWDKDLTEIKIILLNQSKDWSKNDLEILKNFTQNLELYEENFIQVSKLMKDYHLKQEKNKLEQSQNIVFSKLQNYYEQTTLWLDKLYSSRNKLLREKFNLYLDKTFYFNIYLASGVIILGIIILVMSSLLSRTVIKPILEIHNYTQQLAQGENPPKLQLQQDNLLDSISENLSTLAERLQKINAFADAIVYQKSLQSLQIDKEDRFFKTLYELKEKIQLFENQNEVKNWALRGHLLFSELFRKSHTLESLSDEFIIQLCRYVKTQQAALFIVDAESKIPTLVLSSTYAQNATPAFHERFVFGEGLVGQVAVSLETIYLTNIPDDYIHIAVGNTSLKPACLMLVPLISNDNLYGVLEIASLKLLYPEEQEFIKIVSSNFASVVSNIYSHKKTLQLLQQAEELTEKLKLKSDELEKYALELEKNQFEIKQVNQKLEKQMQTLNLTTKELALTEKKLQTILQNSSEVIAIIDEHFSLKYISPSCWNILSYKENDLLGFGFYKFISPEDIEALKNTLSLLFASGYESERTIQIKFKLPNQHSIFLEIQAKNLIEDHAINGFLLNIIDITEKLKAEDNARRRQQFQSLAENSTDLIIRFEKNLKIAYINPVIEKYTGQKPSFYIKNSIYDVDFSQDVAIFWDTMIREVLRNQKIIKTELTIPSIMGDRILKVDIIPEINLENEVESVLALANDITESKIAEKKILQQNQTLEKINEEVLAQKKEIEQINQDLKESINYAKRIQEAFLPDPSLLRAELENIFIFYQPRDIVSGDFYWFQKVGNQYFLAVADCTGHGVPGAFMSLIGHNILNELVNQKELKSTSLILEQLHQEIFRRLKQAESGSKDGMDVALVRIDFSKKIVEFSGAGRPLLWWHQYDLHEIKGNKLGVGGTTIQEDRKYEHHTLNIENGDAIYLFTDGFTDQFGGPQNRKYTSPRFRELLLKNQHKKMPDLENLLRKTFEEWKGNEPQTDDVLVLGIKFIF